MFINRLTWYLILTTIGLFSFILISDPTMAQEKKKKKKSKIEITIGNESKEDNSDKQSDKKSKKKKKKKSAEKLMYLILGSSIFNGVGEAQALSGKDIGNILGVSTQTVNCAINDARNAGALYPTVYNDQYYLVSV